MGSQGNRHDEARNSVLARATMAAMAAVTTWRETGREGRSGDLDAPHPPRAAEDAMPADPSVYDREPDRALGRRAGSPFAIPRKGWWAVARRVYDQIGEDRVMAVAAGVTFYAILALFPALTATVAIYGLFADRATMLADIDALSNVVPPEALSLIRSQLEKLVGSDSGALGLASLFGIVLAIWSANGGMKAMIQALNVAYGEREGRSFIWLNVFGLGMTVSGIAIACTLILAAAVLPAVVHLLPSAPGVDTLVLFARWPLMCLVMFTVLMLLYRFGPSRRAPRMVWVMPGAILGAVLLLGVSAAFSFYTTHFASYSATYGSVGAVVVLMMWIWLSTISVLMGAELNAEAERQTALDSTKGPPKNLGKRNARVADSVA
ncbi:ribonuclease BN [Thioclava dalianensis]|uniref:Ribonuclease BN n=1 Tax=Thioclava dalianensis TaxID=1185766 RepID=A0A074TJE8_9RHOB|nr:YihY/virulence factor BrkB family protein [Thioclava dalianensis]KEP71734.1 ribonuclease BN [Thioclava dalianensis]SFN40081.1 membrane protein [Thioclava dalianensis]